MTKVKTKKFRSIQTLGIGKFYRSGKGVKVDWTLTTGGNGLWSGEERNVKVTGLLLDRWCDDDDLFSENELKVCFSTRSWNTNRHGLIYTDKRWMRELVAHFNKLGLPGAAVDYTEQGRQGDNYVSCSVYGKNCKKFFKKWVELGFPINDITE